MFEQEQLDHTATFTQMTLPDPGEPPRATPAQSVLHIGDVFTYNGREYELLEIRAPLDDDDTGSLVAYDRESPLHLRRLFYNIARFEELSGYTMARNGAG
jgi:hypothetical protein